MATQYTTILKLALPTQGELDGSWGTTVNNNITSMVEEAVAGRSVINSWSGNSHTLTTADGTTAEARAAMLSLTDTGDQLGSNAATVICPTASKIYIVTNAVGQAATLKTASGTGIAIPNGATMLLFCDGTNVVEGINNVTGTLTTAAITASGAITSTGDITAAGTLNATGDPAAGDDAAMGYTAAEGLILTGQGSTSDITVKNDADATVFTVPTGTDDILFPDNAKAIWGAGSDLQVYHDASHSYIVDNGTGNLKIQGTQIDLLGSGETMATFVDDGAATLYYDDSAKIATASGGVAVTGDLTTTGTVEPAGDTASGDNAAIGYTSAEGLILTGQGSTSDVTIKNDADGDVIKIATGTTTVTMTADATVGDDLTLLSDSAVLGFGADTDTTLTHTDGSGLTLNSTNKLMFNDASQFIQGSSGTVLSLGATDEIDLTATAIDINGTTDLSGKVVHSYTSSVRMPSGTTGQRDGSPAVGDFRYNSTTNAFEGYAGSSPSWGSIGGGAGYFLGSGAATGDTTSGLTDIFRVNNAALASNTTIAASTNASATGPLTVNSSVTLTVTGTLVII